MRMTIILELQVDEGDLAAHISGGRLWDFKGRQEAEAAFLAHILPNLVDPCFDTPADISVVSAEFDGGSDE
jgi:hypothetical protein